MRKFVKVVSLFLVPIVVMAMVMEVLLRQIPNAYKTKSAYYEKKHKTIETLILGSSHLEYGVNPDFMFNEALNFANVSQTIDIDCQLLKSLAPQMPNLKYLIVRLSYTTLYEQLKKGDESWRIKDYNLYTPKRLDVKVKHQFEVFSIKLKTNIKRLLDYYVYGKTKIKTSPAGWSVNTNIQPAADLNKKGKAAALKHTVSNKALFNENVAYLDEVVKYCKAQNILVLLVTTPTYKSYYLNVNPKQLQATTQTGKQMMLKYDNCKYYNLIDSPRFLESDFFDGDHLNRNGAKKLTEFLSFEMMKLEKTKK